MSERLEVDGVHLEIARIAGSGPTLVFLHEGLGSVSAWREFPQALCAQTGRAGLVYRRQGYGRSDPLPAPRSVDFMHREADVLARVLEEADVREAVLVGHSDGASIALIRAADPPRHTALRGLVLMAPHVFVEDVCVAAIAAVREGYRDGALHGRLARHHADPDATFDRWATIWLDPAFRAWSIEALLPRVFAPVLVIQGEDDEYGTLAQVDRTVTGVRGQAGRLVLARCGHAPHRDAPEAVRTAAAGFIAGPLTH